jgi:hypothetical protein
MAAKAPVPVATFPRIHRFRGHGPLLQHRRFDQNVPTESHPNPTRSPNGTSPLPFTNQSTGYGGGAVGNSPWASVK